MKAVKSYKIDFEEYVGRKYPIYVIPCPECGYKNVELYPVKLIICRNCNGVFQVGGKIYVEIQNLAEKFGDITQYLPTWEWNAVRRKFERKYNQTE